MPDHLHSIDELPATYRTIVEGIVRANLDLARNGIARLRRLPAQSASMCVIRNANIKTKVYITTTQQKVFFLFIRGPVTDDVMLQLDVDFSVKAMPGVPREESEGPVRLQARIPPLFARDVDARQAALLSAELNNPPRPKIVFLRAGSSVVGAINPDFMPLARAARLDPGATKARVIFQRVASPDSTEERYEYDPGTFVQLLDAVAAWARTGKAAGGPVEVPAPSLASPQPAQRIVAATIAGWTLSRAACPAVHPNRIAGSAMPPFEIAGYRGEVVLRLKADGTLAEKVKDDVFRLRLSMETVEESAGPLVEVSFDPPDFLVSGKLYERLTETLRHAAVVRTLVNSSGVPKAKRERLAQWIADASRTCFVFRAKKRGDTDTDVFVLRSDWEGAARVAIAIVDVKVTKTETDDYVVRFIDAPDSMEIGYTDIPGAADLKSPRVPEYVLMLIHQLRNWVNALRG